jgi:hypothetical protein
MQTHFPGMPAEWQKMTGLETVDGFSLYFFSDP